MVKCNYKRIPRRKLCTGDLRYRITLEERTLTPPLVGQDVPTETFTVLKSLWSGVETVRGTRRFFGVNIEKSATHLFPIRYNPELPLLDGDNFFVHFKDRYFRILRVTNDNEEEYFHILQCAERGEDDKAAARA